ncbi:hypothetical protein ABEF95_016231 [Exophiala dermatitidis]
MDFSYFTSAPQPYPFLGLAQSDSTIQGNRPDEFQTAAPGTDQYDEPFAVFHQNFLYPPSTFIAQSHHAPVQPSQNDPRLLRLESSTSLPETDMDAAQGPEMSVDDTPMGPSSSDEKDAAIMSTQQSRRKAQNRAAQRAFRERKERHLKDVEAKLGSLQEQTAALDGENERLRRELARMTTENEILRATSGSVSVSSGSGSTPFGPLRPDEMVGPLRFVPTDRRPPKAGSSGVTTPGLEIGHKVALSDTFRTIVAVDGETGERVLNAGATWDYIQANELVRNGLVEVGDVCERLKKKARCDGRGPVFLEADVQKAIVESAAAGGRDELI